MSKIVSFIRRLAVLGASLILASCGGGGNEEARLPVTVAEARDAYDTSRSFLCFYPDEGCSKVNLDTVVTWGEYSLTAPVIVTYRGNTIFDEGYSQVYYFVDHGFTSAGVYVLIVARVRNGAFARVFINGTPLNFAGTNDFAGVDVREYSPDWLIVRTERYYLYPAGCRFFMLNIRTGAQVQFIGTDEEMQRACAMK